MPPDRLPTSVLAALGLIAGPACSGVKPCLRIASPDTSDTAQEPTTPCLMYAPTEPTGSTGDTGAAADTGAASSADATFERLAAEGVLPADVVRRLKER